MLGWFFILMIVIIKVNSMITVIKSLFVGFYMYLDINKS